MFLSIQYFWLTKYTKMHRCHEIARRFQTSGPRILYLGFTDHCKSVLENGEPNPLTRLHKNNLRDSFLHESVKKLCFSLVVSDYALKYSGLGSSKYQKDASDFKIFPGEHSPAPTSKASRK